MTGGIELRSNTKSRRLGKGVHLQRSDNNIWNPTILLHNLALNIGDDSYVKGFLKNHDILSYLNVSFNQKISISF